MMFVVVWVVVSFWGWLKREMSFNNTCDEIPLLAEDAPTVNHVLLDPLVCCLDCCFFLGGG